KREMVLRLSSNRIATGKNVVVEPSFPLSIIAKRAFISGGGHSNDSIRTPEEVAEEAWAIGTERLRQARQEQERLVQEREDTRRAEKSSPRPLQVSPPNSITAILAKLDQSSTGSRSEDTGHRGPT